ncbi:MAG: TonB family protein, partial [Candidatus Kapaibacteriota bacterium]
IIKVLVKSDGSVGKYMVEHSENIMLNIAALEAITKYGKFVPAIQNGKTVDCWISIPINFRLR